MKGKEDKIVQIYTSKRNQMKVDPQIDLSDLVAARDDLAIIEKTSNASVRKNTQSALNKHIIGPVSYYHITVKTDTGIKCKFKVLIQESC